MPAIQVDGQIFDVVFHPISPIVYIALLDGHIKAIAYNEQGNHKALFSLQPVKKSCRGLSIDQDGSHLYAVGKGRALSSIDTKTEALDIRKRAHESTINRVKCLMPWLLATGDDDGVVKLWDPRQRDSIRTYSQHFDYISDFLWLDDKKQVVATSGDGTLSVMDVRAKKSIPIAQSEDQEDELLSIVAIKGGAKIVVGTQLGMLSIFNRNSGWGDCVDRIPGHPLSVDALCTLPSDMPGVDTLSTVLTGSSDGLVRAVQILPTKLHGVVVDHGDWPIERIAVGSYVSQLTIDDSDATDNARSAKIGSTSEPNHDEELSKSHRWWVGSVGHDEVLRLTDLGEFFHDNKDEGKDLGVGLSDEDNISLHKAERNVHNPEEVEAQDPFQSTEISGMDQPKKRKRRTDEPSTTKKKGKRNAMEVEKSFFDEI